MELCDHSFQSSLTGSLFVLTLQGWVSFVSLNECYFCRVWWPLCPGGAGRRGAGGHRLEKCRLASSAPSIPGLPALLSHHLLSPRLQHPTEALGADYQRWEQAEHSLLEYGMAALCPPCVPPCSHMFRPVSLPRVWVVCAVHDLQRVLPHQTLSCLLTGLREAFSQSTTSTVTHTGELKCDIVLSFDKPEGKSECSQLLVVTKFSCKSMKLLGEMCRMPSKRHSWCQNGNI